MQYICSCTLGDSGSSLFNFDHKGIVRVPCKELLESSMDPLELAIEVGAEDITTDGGDSISGNETLESFNASGTGESKEDECYQFKCEARDLSSVYTAMKSKPFTVVSSSLEYIPKRMVKLDAEMFDNAEKLMKLLNEHEDVMEVHDNFTLNDDCED